MFQKLIIKSFSFPKFFKSPFHLFSSNKKNIKPIESLVKPLWHNIFKRLQGFADELDKIEKHLRGNSDLIDSRSQDSLRIRMNDIIPIASLHEKYRNIFKGLEDLEEMGRENHDKETLQFISDEQANYRYLLEELEEKAIEFLIPVSKFDDCLNVDVEIRPGFYQNINNFKKYNRCWGV